MKFNILDYSQRIAISMGLDLKDLHILGWVQDFYPKMKKMIIDGEEYVWLNYQSLIEDMPILEIETKDALYRRLKNLVEIGLLKHRGVKNSSGSFSYYRLTEKIMELLEDKHLRGGTDEKSDGTDEKSDGKDKKSDRVGIKSRNKDSSTSNSSTKSFLSLPAEEKKDFLKKIWLEKKLKSSPEKYFLFREKTNWKGLSNLEADIAWWENGFKDKNPDLYVEKSTGPNLSPVESPEITKIRSDIKGEICRDNEKGYLDYQNFFFGKVIEKTASGFVIKVSDEKALRYEEVLREINVRIEKYEMQT